MPSLCAFVTDDGDNLFFFHAGRTKGGAVVNLRGVRFIGSFVYAGLNVFPDRHLDAVLGPSEAGAVITGFGQASCYMEREAHERIDLTLYQRLSYHFGFRRQLSLFVVWTFS